MNARIMAVALVLLASWGSAYGQSTLLMGGSVADALSGNNVIIGSPGGNVTVFLVLTDTDAAGLGPVRSYQMAVTCDATPLGGATGTVSHNQNGATGCGAASPCVDLLNPNYIFAAAVAVSATSPGPCPGGLPRGLSDTIFGFQAQNCGAGQACYILEFSYAISGNATGDHAVTIQNPDPGGDSFIRAEPFANLPFAFANPGAIIRLPGDEACCFPNGACGDILTQDCTKFGGTFQGVGTDCASASCSACPSDLDGNGEVRVPDLIKLLGDWGQCPAPILAVCTESTNDCCTSSPNLTPGCNNSACCECICACDPFCCGLNAAGDGRWDAGCGGCGFGASPCGASNPNSGCADVCAACVDPGMCP